VTGRASAAPFGHGDAPVRNRNSVAGGYARIRPRRLTRPATVADNDRTMTGRQTLTITLAMCGLLLTATVALWLVGPAAAAQADADSPTEAAKPAGDGSGPATQPTSATDPSKPQRVIVQVNRRRTIHGTLQMHDDELIVVRDRSGELHSFPVSRVMRVVKLVDPVPGQTGVVFLNNGQTREGVIIEDAYEHVLMEIEGIRAKLSRDHVDHVELKPTFQQQYESYKAQLQPGQTRNHLTLCHWLIDQRKYELARTELLELLKHDPENHEANRMMRIVEAQLELLAGGFRTSEDQRENGAEDGDGSKRSGPVYAKDLLPKEIISAEDVNIIRVYEIDFENPPRVSVSPETIRKLIEHYGTSELMPASQTERTELFRADYFEEEVRRRLASLYGTENLYEGGLEVRTTLEPRLQAIAEQALHDDGAEGAHHEERAMREVHDAERAEDDREPQRDERVGAPLVEPVQDLQEYRVHRPVPSGEVRPPERGGLEETALSTAIKPRDAPAGPLLRSCQWTPLFPASARYRRDRSSGNACGSCPLRS